MTIKPILISAFESALNTYLNLDEEVSIFLSPLAGKVIAVTITPFNETLYLCPSAEKIQILDTYFGQCDTTLTGSLPAFGFMGLSSTPARYFFSGDVAIEGDLNIGHQFQSLFEKLDIDIEEHVSHITGDVIAHKLGNLLHNVNRWQQDNFKSAQLNITEFLQDETQDLPPEPEINLFSKRVAHLKEDFDRLDARITRLNKYLNENKD